MVPAMYRKKPPSGWMLAGLRSDSVAVADWALPEPNAIAPSCAVLLRVKGAPAVQGKKFCGSTRTW